MQCLLEWNSQTSLTHESEINTRLRRRHFCVKTTRKLHRTWSISDCHHLTSVLCITTVTDSIRQSSAVTVLDGRWRVRTCFFYAACSVARYTQLQLTSLASNVQKYSWRLLWERPECVLDGHGYETDWRASWAVAHSDHRRLRRTGCRGCRGRDPPPPIFWQVFYFFPSAELLNTASRCHFHLQCTPQFLEHNYWFIYWFFATCSAIDTNSYQ